MSTIAAGTTSGSALVSTGDTTGQLVLQTNGSTTAVTIGTNQVVSLAQPLPIASGGTNSTATATAGGVGYGTGTAHAYTSAGTSGYFLQSNGSSAPSWVAPSTGALVLISTTTASGSANTFDITTGFSSTYDDYLIIGENIRLGVTGSDYMAFRMYTGGSVRTSSYQYNSLSIITAPSVSKSTSDSSVPMVSQVYGSTSVISFNIFLRNANSASARIQGQLSVACTDDSNADGNNQNNTMFGNTATTSALSGIRLYWPGNASSTFSSGTMRLYGIAKS